jgi:lysozyme
LEGYAPVAKHERADPPGVITACYGMTNYDRPLKAGERFTKPECQKYLAEDLPRYAVGVRKCVPGFDDMPAPRQAALVSFAYNIGAGGLCKSRVAKLLNAGQVQAGCDDMLMYVYANGKYLKGLDNRRKTERALCLKDH